LENFKIILRFHENQATQYLIDYLGGLCKKAGLNVECYTADYLYIAGRHVVNCEQ